MKMALRHLLPLLFVLALAACGNKGPLVLPSAPGTPTPPAAPVEPVEEDAYGEDDDSGSAARGA